jgi:threonine dehydrogenase-like Zn-dependent dehydrogenase
MLGVKILGREQVAVRDFPMPASHPDRVLIQVKASGICGSEMGAYRRDAEHPSNGGHEVVGVVVEPGDATRIRAGDHVGVHAVWGCGECEWCAAGQYTYCPDLRHSGGAHAQFVSAPEHVCLRLPEDVPWDDGVLVTGDGMGVPYRVSQRLATAGGETVCIVGAGPVGLGNAIVQSYLGAEVIAVDVNPYRLELARACGATHTINASETDPVEAVRDITSGLGADTCIEAAGAPETFRVALRAVRKAGVVMVVGEQPRVEINPSADLIHRDVSVMGSLYYHYSDYPAMLDLYRRGLPIGTMITHHFPLTDAAEAFKTFAEGRAGKVVLEP